VANIINSKEHLTPEGFDKKKLKPVWIEEDSSFSSGRAARDERPAARDKHEGAVLLRSSPRGPSLCSDPFTLV
jgi:hypothetical protein